MKTFYKLTFPGFLQHSEKYFHTEARAIQYAQQIGKAREATITQECADYWPLTIQGTP